MGTVGSGSQLSSVRLQWGASIKRDGNKCVLDFEGELMTLNITPCFICMSDSCIVSRKKSWLSLQHKILFFV